ncbi:hypothetical protein QOZ80_7BG0605870 [Eleusine coracana subsp. coracana]|nr:hypothetical protein QOZ80_7BG0605870 [Eleusine coracana subsp. coracana]
MTSFVSHSLLLVLGALLLSSLDTIKPSSSEPLHPAPEDEHAEEDYPRFAEVQRHCRPVLSSASVLADDPHRSGFVKRFLSFEKGDWRQAPGHAPLMPFDGRDDARRRPPLSLATFMLTHVGEGKYGGQTTAVNVSGVLFLSVSRKSRDSDIWPREPRGPVTSPEFKISPGETKLRIVLEGVYTESATSENDEEAEIKRVLCMVGRAHLPMRDAGPWDWAKNSGRGAFSPPVTEDGNIVLVLRSPKEPSLTNRAVLGEMRSTNAESAAGYFDPVHLVSRLLWYPLHKARSEELVSGACSPPLPAIEAEDVAGKPLFKGRFLCEVLSRYGHGIALGIRSQRHCDCAANSCRDRDLGPFETDRDADADELLGVGSLMMQDLHCDTGREGGVENISAVFRAVPSWEDPYTAARRSGLSGMTLSAEGVWNASAGQACMVACRGIGDTACHFRVCMYMPMTFSLADRSVLVGRITSISAPAQSSLSFQPGLTSPRYWAWDGERLAFTYNYTKVELARDVLRRGASLAAFDLRKFVSVMSSLPLRYPRPDYGNGDHATSLAYLAEELTLRFMTTPRMLQPEWIEQPVLRLEIIFLDQVSDRNAILLNYVSKTSRVASKVPPVPDRQSPINVSAQLTAVGDTGITAFSVMSLEGVYSPEEGLMQLVGCLVNRALDEEEMDCSIEMRVEYPPTNTHWLFIWSTAKVHIASMRDAGDPLHFDTMQLRSIPQYRKPRPDNVSRGIADGVLCIVLLLAAVAAAGSQLRHLKAHADVAPYVSLVMLGVQALGFGVPLVTADIQALLGTATSRSDDIMASAMPTFSYMLNRMSRVYRTIYLAVNFLCVGAFVLTLWIAEKVRRSRARMLARSPLEPGRVPGDAKVFVYHCIVHLALFVLVLALNGQAMTVEQHIRLMQDLFLLPQVIGNVVWRVNCKPLAKGFYLGVTAIRLLPHVYEYVRPPPPVTFTQDENGNGSWSVFFPSGAGSLVTPAVAVLLGVVVYVQQRWNYAIVGRMGVAEQAKWQHTI